MDRGLERYLLSTRRCHGRRCRSCTWRRITRAHVMAEGADVAEGAAPNSAELSRGQTDENVDWQRPLPS